VSWANFIKRKTPRLVERKERGDCQLKKRKNQQFG